jgi:branched-chain amino acid transport system permease protein
MLTMLYIQAVLDGLILGGLYAVIAVGLGLAFGVMRMVNFAHGECLMISMYLANSLIMTFGMDPYLTIPITGSVMFLAGFLLQKGVFNRIIEKDNAREPQRVLLFTSGMGMVLTNGCILLFTSNTRMVRTAYSASSFNIGEFFFTAPRLIAFAVAMICTGALYLFLQKSELGRALRATSQNRMAAKLMGINEKVIYALAFGIGLGLVGISASVLVPFFPFSPNLGLIFGFKSFVIVVLGGLGSVPGALLGGLIVGVIEKVGGMLTTDVYAQAMLFLLFVGILLVKPSGLLGKEVE